MPQVESIFQRVVFVYEPTGTDCAATTNLTPGLTKSASDVMFFGFPWATITQRLFVVKFVDKLLYTSPELFSCLVHLMSADIKTSHGEPEVICVYSVLDEAELTTMLQSFALSNAWVMFAMTLVKLDAANIVRVTGGGLAVGVGVAVGWGVGEAVGVGVSVAMGDVVGESVAAAVGAGVGVDDTVAVGVGNEEILDFAKNVPLYAK